MTFTEEDAERAGLNRPTRSGKPSNHMKFPRNMKFARAISNGVGLHCPDLTAGTPVYTLDELGADDPDADVAPAVDGDVADDHTPPSTGPTDGDRHAAEVRAALTETAFQCGYEAATVVELGRFFYAQPRLEALSDVQAVELAERLGLAQARGISDATLRAVAIKGLRMGDPPRARRAADVGLTSRARTGAGERPAA